jgi:type IV pilus biogenesis protein CpaD/CtpE
MKALLAKSRWVLLLLLAAAALNLSGCASTDEIGNASVRPWDSPKGFETGIPSSMTEGH